MHPQMMRLCSFILETFESKMSLSFRFKRFKSKFFQNNNPLSLLED